MSFVTKNDLRIGSALIRGGVYIGDKVEIGDNTEVKPGCVLCDNLVIGSDCLIGPNVCFIRPQKKYKLSNHTGSIYSPTIGNGVFIGAGSIIGASICDFVTIGALSFVAIRITQIGTYVGNPLKKIKSYSMMI